MQINLGSTSQLKFTAVEAALKLYPDLVGDFTLTGIDPQVAEFGHPKDINETINGAIERAKKAYQNCELSIGIEGGLLEVPGTISGFMETSACAIYDGKQIYLGLGPCFEWPKKVTEMILEDGVDASQAFKILGLTTEEKLGGVNGGINGFLTKGRLTREESIRQSVMMAMIYVENKSF